MRGCGRPGMHAGLAWNVPRALQRALRRVPLVYVEPCPCSMLRMENQLESMRGRDDSACAAAQKRIRIGVADMAVDVAVALRVRRHHRGSAAKFRDERILEKR